MEIRITKGRSEDRIRVTRTDGSLAETRFPKKGPVPHDAVHLFVERGFRLREGFWGMVAAGHHPEALGDLAKAAGHASAARARVPDPAIVELIQAERLTECFEAELWGGTSDDAALLAVAAAACEASHVALPAVPVGAVKRVRAEIAAFAAQWIAADDGFAARLEWE